jgi:pyruvate dehydrogenase E1 component alpha subunit
MGDRLRIRELELGRLSKMLLIRRFEEEVFRQYTLPGQLLGGFQHLCSGQEAIAVGTAEVFQTGLDVYAGSFRSHGWSLALGMSPRAAMAELYARATGCCGGKAGSMHLADAATGNLGGWNVVASQMPVGAGAAFAAAYRKTGGVAFVVFGDGAINQGVCSETLNMASLLKLPVVFLLEDNGIAMGTKVERHSAEPDLVRRGEAYAMRCRGFDGNDVEEVIRQVGEAAEHARNGLGPSFLVAKTFRFRGFSMSDPLKYRSREEAAQARARDPIVLYSKLLQQRSVLNDLLLDQMDDQVTGEIDDALEFAKASPQPGLEERWANLGS